MTRIYKGLDMVSCLVPRNMITAPNGKQNTADNFTTRDIHRLSQFPSGNTVKNYGEIGHALVCYSGIPVDSLGLVLNTSHKWCLD